MKVERLSENPVLVGGDYKRACLFFDEVVPVIWPRGETETDIEAGVAQYMEYSEALESPLLKKRLIKSKWRALITVYGYFAIARFVFFKLYMENPKADGWQIARATLDFMKHKMEGMDEKLVSEFFPSPELLVKEIAEDPLKTVFSGLASGGVYVDTYACPTKEETEDTVDAMLSKVEVVQCDNIGWDQIGEIREDVEATKDLRSLRRFVFSDMKGYTKSHVEDILMKAMEDHKKSARKWGLTTLPSQIKVDCEGAILAGFLTAIGVATAGLSIAAAAGIGLITPLAQALFTINKGRRSMLEGSKVKYLIRLEREAGNWS